jgi:hypothetical protein
MTPFISVLHPTARGPKVWQESMRQWHENADHPENIEYIVCVDGEDSTIDAFADAKTRWFEFQTVFNKARRCSLDAYNTAAAFSSGELLVGNMDDLFAPLHWDTLLLSAATPCHDAIDKEHVLHCTTGSPRDNELFIPQILTRARYQRLGYMFHPSYITGYGDDEFTAHARFDGCVIDARHIRFEHKHPTLGTAETDPTYEHQNQAEWMTFGKKNFIRRLRAGFPKEDVV